MLAPVMANDSDNTDSDDPSYVINLADDDEMIDSLWWFWIVTKTNEKGIPLCHCSPQLIEIIRLETLRTTTDRADVAPLLQVMKDIAIGERARAAKVFRGLVVEGVVNLKMFDTVETARRKQSERASQPRGNDLTLLVREIVEKRRQISEQEMLALLDRLAREGHPVVRHITDGIIYWTSKDPPIDRETNVSALRSLLSREKK